MLVAILKLLSLIKFLGITCVSPHTDFESNSTHH